jgi:branched-chain amino acid transport system substrate-binding protein
MNTVKKWTMNGLALLLLVVFATAGTAGIASATSSGSKTITIGLTWPRSGAAEPEYDGFGQGATAAIDAANASGGVDGYKIKAVDYDDASTTSGNLAATRYLFESAGALTVLEAPLDPGNVGYIQQTGYPVITGPGGYNGVSAPLKNLIPVGGRNVQTQFETADIAYLKSLGVTKLALLTEQNASVLGQALQNYATKTLGMDVVYTNYNFGYVPTDYAPVASAMQSAGVQGVFCILGQPIESAVYEAAHEAGETFKGFDMVAAYNATFAKEEGPQLQGTYTETGFEPFTATSIPGMKTYLAAMKKYEPAWEYNEFGEDGYGAGLAAIEAIQKTVSSGKPVNRSNFLTSLQSIHNFDADGLYLPLKNWDDEDGCEWILKMENSHWVQVSKKAVCAPFAQL